MKAERQSLLRHQRQRSTNSIYRKPRDKSARSVSKSEPSAPLVSINDEPGAQQGLPTAPTGPSADSNSYLYLPMTNRQVCSPTSRGRLLAKKKKWDHLVTDDPTFLYVLVWLYGHNISCPYSRLLR